MGAKTVLFLVAFVGCCAGAIFTPLLGILGYIGHYCIGPERQWWEAPIQTWGIRYSYMLALATAVGTVLRWRSLRYGETLFRLQEYLILGFLLVILLSMLFGEKTEGFYTTVVDHPSLKMAKVFFVLLMLTHIVTTERDLDYLLWLLVGAALLLGYNAYTTPLSQFARGRLETIGGADFVEANFFGAFLASILPLVGVQFLRSGWIGKLVCLTSGVFATNAIILTRSRGVLVGIGAGLITAVVVAITLAPRRYRNKILIGLAIAVAGGIYLADPGFIMRADTILHDNVQEMGTSAMARWTIWKTALRMIGDTWYGFGVGAGNFFQTIKHYDGALAGRDAHNTYLRCFAELGIQGLAVLAALVFVAARSIVRSIKSANRLPEGQGTQLMYLACGLGVGLATVLVSAVTITLIYNEFFWWFLALPVCVERALANLKADNALLPEVAPA